MKSIIVAVIGIISAIYLLNPTGGFIEFIPDNFPVIGNLDEVAATTLILSCLSYFGIDLFNIFKRDANKPTDKDDIDNKEIDNQ